MGGRESLKLLLPRSINFAGSGGGKAEVTWEDIASALAYGKLDDYCRMYAQLKYGELTDRDKINSLKFRVSKHISIHHVYEDFIREGWATNDGRIVYNLSSVALDEALEERTKCSACGGHKVVITEDHKRKDCEKCLGTGRQPFSLAEVARRLGLDIDYFERSAWRDRYKRTLQNYYEYDFLIGLSVRRYLGTES